jgi:hypothetical protein
MLHPTSTIGAPGLIAFFYVSFGGYELFARCENALFETMQPSALAGLTITDDA